ncbi:MAG: TlpA family protein disulfide reductase [Acidobacteria bacterium]|nr:MAG: TlpA family protein disulfide reductase [Acidobacteriota bacterium]
MPAIARGQTAPPIELAATDGKKYSLQEALARGPVLATFFKVSCPTCQYTLPFVERLYQQFRDQRVEVWGVSQDNAKESEGFAKEFGLSFPVLIDENDYAVSTEYGLEYVPSYFLIAAGGKIEISGDGFSKRDFLAIQRLLAARLAAKPPALFQTTEMVPEFKPG